MVDVEIVAVPPGAVSLEILDPDHYNTFCTAFKHLFARDVVLETSSQLFDGIPLNSVVREAAGARNLKGSPVSLHETLCEGALDKAKGFISSFNPASLKFEDSVCVPRPASLQFVTSLC